MEADETRTKAQELLAAKIEVQKLRSLIQHEGWKLLHNLFADKLADMERVILNNATRLEYAGRAVDSSQAALLEAMEKGEIKGMLAIFRFPAQFIEHMQEQIELLEKTIKLENEEEETNDD